MLKLGVKNNHNKHYIITFNNSESRHGSMSKKASVASNFLLIPVKYYFYEMLNINNYKYGTIFAFTI